MNHLIARIRTRKKERLFKLLSDQENVFDLDVENLSLVDYDVDHNLDEESWFKVEEFSQKDYFLEYVGRAFVAAEYNDLKKEEFTKIAFLCSVQGGNFFFQKVSPSTYLTKKFIGFGDVACLETSDTRLYVNQYPDAVYLAEEDVLVFKKLATISSIFPGIDTIYKEATNDEVQEFLNKDFIELRDGFNLDKVSKPNRARIALALNSLGDMKPDDQKSMLNYIHGYSDERLEYDQDNKIFSIQTDEQLKLLLYGIEERFYTTPIGQQKRLANSVQSLG
ncbi:hypothetical protein SYK_31260 [Pseudodesulfovibrio nedwellii]|uniref:ATP F0F1 synthase synthase n=1 Tax=Pseudodesulfovibrio nedwellii TaxID=2973072 RepID=A0ABM8B4M0_9BACT|nr:hypothetical protein [Pseudodesulfovibrio nedwellii]BDQ38766.1 hypothetical protein SYK_31260 [Pseudodesulfovibrio nedwellii]